MPLKIPCQSCGAKNPLGKIYCEKCGEALDVSGMEHKLRDNESAFSFRRLFSLFRSIASFVLLILVLGFLVGIFLPVTMAEKGQLADQERTRAKEKHERLTAECAGKAIPRQAGHTFSQKEVTFLANLLAGLPDVNETDAGLALAPVELSVEILDDRVLRLVLHSRVLKNLDVYSTLVGQIRQKDGAYSFVTTRTKVGKVPFPGKAGTIVEKRFSQLFSEVQSLDAVLKNAETIGVSDGQLIIKAGNNKSR